MNRDVFPPAIVNLLLGEGQRFTDNGKTRAALGTGILPL